MAMLQQEIADFNYRLGITQGKADQWAYDFRNEVLRHEAEVERIARVGRERMLTVNKNEVSASVATSEETRR